MRTMTNRDRRRFLQLLAASPLVSLLDLPSLIAQQSGSHRRDARSHRQRRRRAERLRLRGRRAGEAAGVALGVDVERCGGWRHDSRQSRRLRALSAPRAPAGGRQQDRHVGHALRQDVGDADLPVPGERTPDVQPAGRAGHGACGEGEEASADALDDDDDAGRRGERGARRAGVVPALHAARVVRRRASS